MTRNVDIKFKNIPTVVYSCFILHNFCKSKNECFIDGDELQAQIERHRSEEQEHVKSTEEGEYIRNLLCKYIQRYLPEGYYKKNKLNIWICSLLCRLCIINKKNL